MPQQLFAGKLSVVMIKSSSSEKTDEIMVLGDATSKSTESASCHMTCVKRMQLRQIHAHCEPWSNVIAMMICGFLWIYSRLEAKFDLCNLKAEAVGWIQPGSALQNPCLVTTFEINSKVSQAGVECGICGMLVIGPGGACVHAGKGLQALSFASLGRDTVWMRCGSIPMAIVQQWYPGP